MTACQWNNRQAGYAGGRAGNRQQWSRLGVLQTDVDQRGLRDRTLHLRRPAPASRCALDQVIATPARRTYPKNKSQTLEMQKIMTSSPSTIEQCWRWFGPRRPDSARSHQAGGRDGRCVRALRPAVRGGLAGRGDSGSGARRSSGRGCGGRWSRVCLFMSTSSRRRAIATRWLANYSRKRCGIWRHVVYEDSVLQLHAAAGLDAHRISRTACRLPRWRCASTPMDAAVFDLFMLKRVGAEASYTDAQRAGGAGALRLRVRPKIGRK